MFKFLSNWYNKVKKSKHDTKVLKSMGWEATCHSCNSKYFADNCAVYIYVIQELIGIINATNVATKLSFY